MKSIKILFVCSGNICRSPIANGIMDFFIKKNFFKNLKIDSAGLNKFHIGESPDQRAQDCAESHGYDISKQKARFVNENDFLNFDHILAMDNNHLKRLKCFCPKKYCYKINLFLKFAEKIKYKEIPDPYYGSMQDFETVINLCEIGAKELLKFLYK